MATDGHGGLIQPRKVPNPVRESQSHRELHRELLFSHSRGILPRHRAELPRVLESRRLRQLREELQGPPSDLEQQLRKCHQRLEEPEEDEAGGAGCLADVSRGRPGRAGDSCPGTPPPRRHTGLPPCPAHPSAGNGTRRCHSGRARGRGRPWVPLPRRPQSGENQRAKGWNELAEPGQRRGRHGEVAGNGLTPTCTCSISL
ncbi:uncharacterized protein LOC115335188 isoform X3 [Aquila chrysaetos chrysaetos]|nr:uncharacterized protein LOC115335188 isoform X3 [Aquila chrysaetos chrysaetos]